MDRVLKMNQIILRPALSLNQKEKPGCFLYVAGVKTSKNTCHSHVIQKFELSGIPSDQPKGKQKQKQPRIGHLQTHKNPWNTN